MSALNRTSRRHIALIGFKACGKTTVGHAIAQVLGLPFFDSDWLMMQKYPSSSISEIYHTLGEAHFRSLESEVVASLRDMPPCVFATGGGALSHPQTREVLKATSWLIYLKAPMEKLEHRIWQQETLPAFLAHHPHPEHHFEALYKERSLFYEAWADEIVDAAREFDEIVNVITRGL